MTLASLIRKRDTGKPATAIPAISATRKAEGAESVARIAAVAVANPNDEQTAPPARAGAGETLTVSRWWLIHYADRDPVEVYCCPDATHAETLERHPDAIAAEPFAPAVRQPPASMTANEELAIRTWLAQIEETDPATIADVLHQCHHDADSRAYFIGRAAADNLQKILGNSALDDDRRTCSQCANLVARRCLAVRRGEVVASRNYEPIRHMLKRCEGYAPGADDPDRRHGRERWPGLIQKGGE